ncbi:MAG: hypothetical protein LBH16_03470 [Treponema sp.]|jgi:hypothetical protein|nr:hypothetical protein [Treponema sp.]
MENKKIYMPFVMVFVLFISCTSNTQPVETTAAVAEPVKDTAAVTEPVKDTVAVTEPVKDTEKKPAPEVVVLEAPEVKTDVIIEEYFDPDSITEEQFILTKIDVQHFIEELNQAIRNRNYQAWKAALSQEYFDELSSKENLKLISELPAMKTRKIVLKTPQDYFIHVVVPSRANSRVDDIEFIGEHRVKAFTINTNRAGREVKLRLYDLEVFDDKWKIIN